MTPRITVITPTYRKEPNLHRMAQCLNAQTTDISFEWLIVDRIKEERPANYYEVIADNVNFNISVVKPKHSIFHDHNMPAVASARNTGLIHANGELICWVDDNNWINPKYLEKHWATHTKSHAYYGLGLIWPFKSWDTIDEFSKVEPYNADGVFCRKGTWEENNPQYNRGDVDPREDCRPYLNYNHPNGLVRKLDQYEIVGGAWCYNGNVSYPLVAALKVNGYDEWYDGGLASEDIDMGLRLCNAGYTPLLDRSNSTYEFTGADNDNIKKTHPFEWGYIAEVAGTKVTRGEFQLWSIMQDKNIVRANPNFDLAELRNQRS